MAKGCVSAVLVHVTFDPDYLDGRVAENLTVFLTIVTCSLRCRMHSTRFRRSLQDIVCIDVGRVSS